MIDTATTEQSSESLSLDEPNLDEDTSLIQPGVALRGHEVEIAAVGPEKDSEEPKLMRPEVSVDSEVVTVTLPSNPGHPVEVIINGKGATTDTTKLGFDLGNWDLPQYVLVEREPGADAPELEISVNGGERVLIPVPTEDDDEDDED